MFLKKLGEIEPFSSGAVETDGGRETHRRGRKGRREEWRVEAVNEPATKRVFISSTVYDLVDLRAELAGFLEAQGFTPVASENLRSGFQVHSDKDTIATCLANVAGADVLVAILDQRYGDRLQVGDRSISPVEAEIREAHRLKKSVFLFARRHTVDAFHTKNWESVKPDDRDGLQELITYWRDQKPGVSNWMESFETVLDLKPLLLRRLTDEFPEMRGKQALHPDRFVRLTWRESHTNPVQPDGATGVHGDFENVGVGPVFNLRYGIHPGVIPLDDLAFVAPMGGEVLDLGGLREGCRAGATIGRTGYVIMTDSVFLVFCEYENRFGDRYRIDACYRFDGKNRPIRADPPERIYIWDVSKLLAG
jgi:hypothetical protein